MHNDGDAPRPAQSEQALVSALDWELLRKSRSAGAERGDA